MITFLNWVQGLSGIGTMIFAVLIWRQNNPPKVEPYPDEKFEVTKPLSVSEPEAPQSEAGAQAIDPENPPRYVVYNPDIYDAGRAPSCTCHSLKIVKGERILLWPIPGHPDNGMDVYCAETYSLEEGEQ